MSRGGYRSGAGRPGWEALAGQCLSLDVRRLHRTDALRVGRDVHLQWEKRGAVRRAVDVRFTVVSTGLTLRVNDESGEQFIPLERTRCNFGGTRVWFGCPHCGGRVALLYMRSGRFACRRCQRVSYGSQLGYATEGAWSKQRKAEAQLGSNGERPKGMHVATYARLWSTIIDCEAARSDDLLKILERWRRHHA